MRRKFGVRRDGLSKLRGFGISRCLKTLGETAREDGAAIVEMAVSCTLLLGVLISIVELSLALYAYDATSEAAREAVRWAIVRGTMCTVNEPTLSGCGAQNSNIQTYVQGLGLPYSNIMTTTTNWVTGTVGTNSNGNLVTTWSACSPNTEANCAIAGNQVQVTVTTKFPVRFLFWTARTITMQSTAAMVISQ